MQVHVPQKGEKTQLGEYPIFRTYLRGWGQNGNEIFLGGIVEMLVCVGCKSEV